MTGLRHAQRASKTVFLCVSVRMSLEESGRLVFESVDSVKENAFTSVCGDHPIHLRAWREQKGGRFAVSARAETSVFSCPWTQDTGAPTSQAFRLRPRLGPSAPAHPHSQTFGLRLNYPPAFLVLQFADRRSWGFSTSIMA